MTKEQEKFINQLKILFSMHPTWRIGQVLSNVIGPDPYYYQDIVLNTKLEDYIKGNKLEDYIKGKT